MFIKTFFEELKWQLQFHVMDYSPNNYLSKNKEDNVLYAINSWGNGYKESDYKYKFIKYLDYWLRGDYDFYKLLDAAGSVVNVLVNAVSPTTATLLNNLLPLSGLQKNGTVATEIKNKDYLISSLTLSAIILPFYLLVSVPVRLTAAVLNLAISIPINTLLFLPRMIDACIDVFRMLKNYKEDSLYNKYCKSFSKKFYYAAINPFVSILNSFLSSTYAVMDVFAVTGLTLSTPVVGLFRWAVWGIYDRYKNKTHNSATLSEVSFVDDPVYTGGDEVKNTDYPNLGEEKAPAIKMLYDQDELSQASFLEVVQAIYREFKTHPKLYI